MTVGLSMSAVRRQRGLTLAVVPGPLPVLQGLLDRKSVV